MAAVVMVASSHNAHGRPKSGLKLSSTSPTATTTVRCSPSCEEATPQKPLLSPGEVSESEFQSKEKESAPGHEGSNSGRRYVNETAEFRSADIATLPVNIGTNSSVILRRRGKKAPKPLPYLQPISTYLAAETKDRNSTPIDGRICEPRRRKRVVTFAAPSSLRSGRVQRVRQHRAGRVSSEKLSRGQRRVLAYLVVDLESGTISSSSEDMSVSSMETLTGGGTQPGTATPTTTTTRERSVTTPASIGGSKPVPLPRKKKAEKDDPEQPHTSCSSDRRETITSPTPPPQSPAKKPTPDREESPPTPPQDCSSSISSSTGSGNSVSLVSARKCIFELNDNKDKSPKGTPPPPPIRKSSISIKSPTETSSPSSSSLPCLQTTKSSSPAPPIEESSIKPPPLPAKSELSRKIQKSIKTKNKSLSPSPPSQPQPYEAASPMSLLELNERFDTRTNNSYGVHGSDNDYVISDLEERDPSPPNMADDKPEEVYIDPTASKEFSSTGKPRPPRPPPPSISAIKKVQRRKAAAAVSTVLKTKQLTKRHSSPSTLRAPPTGRRNVKKNTLKPYTSTTSLRPQRPHTSTTLFPSPLKPIISLEEENEDQLYEELDLGRSSGPSILWKPPTSENSTPTVIVPVTTGTSSLMAAGPSLPARKQKPAQTSTTDESSKTSKSSEHHLSTKSPRQSRQISPAQEDDNDSLELKSEDESETYELVDNSAPLAPRRMKRNIKGTNTSPRRGTDNIYNKDPKPKCKSTRSTPPPRRSPPAPPSPCNTKLDEKGTVNGTPKMEKSIIGNEKASDVNSLPVKLSNLSMKDIGGVEEYVDMDYNKADRNSEEEEEDGPEVYVDMQPPSKVEDDIDEPSSSTLRPYVRI